MAPYTKDIITKKDGLGSVYLLRTPWDEPRELASVVPDGKEWKVRYYIAGSMSAGWSERTFPTRDDADAFAFARAESGEWRTS